jgi:hypothetical protein
MVARMHEEWSWQMETTARLKENEASICNLI